MASEPAMKHNVIFVALVMIASYAVQRLIDAQSEPPMGTVVLQATIPYYWRTAMAVIHGALVLVLASVLKLRYQPPAWLCGVVIAVAAMAMVMVP